MINVDAIKELIDQAPEIKTLFTIESYPVASMYDYNTGTHNGVVHFKCSRKFPKNLLN